MSSGAWRRSAGTRRRGGHGCSPRPAAVRSTGPGVARVAANHRSTMSSPLSCQPRRTPPRWRWSTSAPRRPSPWCPGGRGPGPAQAGPAPARGRCNAMSGSGVPDGDMPSFPWPMHQDESDVTDVGLAALLAGKADAVAGLQPVADVLAALTADATSEELANEASALAEFRRAVGVSAHQQRPHRRRPTVLKSLLSAKAAAAVGTIAVLLGGAATAAFAN